MRMIIINSAKIILFTYRVTSVTDSQVPDELCMLIEDFRRFMDQQKATSEEISKVSENFDKQFKNIQSTIDHEKQVVNLITLLLYS